MIALVHGQDATALERDSRPALVRALRRQHCESAGIAFEGSKQADGEWLATFAIITTSATDDVGHIHDRMALSTLSWPHRDGLRPK